MQNSFSRRWAIIGALVLGPLLLGGCNALRLAYNNGPVMAWWWIDGYVDFSRDDTPRAKEAIAQWFAWVRETQLREAAVLLASAAQAVPEPTTAAHACAWADRARKIAEPALERGLMLAALQLPALGPAQLAHIEQHFRKKDEEVRDDFLQSDPTKRRRAAVKRDVDRAEKFYGTLGEAQRRVIAAAVAASPFDPEVWMVERERRQRELLMSLRKLVADRADTTHTAAALRQWVEHLEHSPVPAYRAYQHKLSEHNCAAAAELHNSTTPAQRQEARKRLKEWEDDVRALINERAP